AEAEAFGHEAEEAEAEAFGHEAAEAEAEAFEQEGQAESFEEYSAGARTLVEPVAGEEGDVPAAEDLAAFQAEGEDEEEVELEVEVPGEMAEAAPEPAEEAEADGEVAAEEAYGETIPQPQTPLEEPPEPAEPLDPEENQPRHRTLPHPAFSNFRQRSRNKEKRSVSFHQANVPDGHLLEDETGLRAVHHLLSFREHDLWFVNPGASVQCDVCSQAWPQAFGLLCGGEEGGSQFAQTGFMCKSCYQSQEEPQQQGDDAGAWSQEEVADAEAAVTSEEAVGASTGPWDNPQSGWGDWIHAQE
ncbi:p65, partial [Symbiodinium pilosum]